jgi:hypothetical protein
MISILQIGKLMYRDAQQLVWGTVGAKDLEPRSGFRDCILHRFLCSLPNKPRKQKFQAVGAAVPKINQDDVTEGDRLKEETFPMCKEKKEYKHLQATLDTLFTWKGRAFVCTSNVCSRENRCPCREHPAQYEITVHVEVTH